nr:OmpA family protein [Gammaproteobacteria bacterium]
AKAPEPIVAPAIKTIAPKPVVKTPVDSDQDGVLDADDLCPGSLPGQPVDTKGCLLFTGALDGVNFVSASAELLPQSVRVLENVAAQLILFPELQVEISAHTDDVGDASYNLALSKKRVITVGRFLLERGIARTRFRLKAFGERKPLVPNTSADNRARNRRVEFHILGSDGKR